MTQAKRVHSTPRRTASKTAPKAGKKKKATSSKEQMDGLGAKRAKAYLDMEPHLCDLVRMGEIAAMMFDKDEGLFIFATTHLEEMLQQFRARYYAEGYL